MAGKSISFIVNNYDNSTDADSSTVTSPLSYFVLGAEKGDTADPVKALRGDELVEGMAFKDDLRDTVRTNKTYYRDTGKSGEKTSSLTRSELSAELLTRGGYREHTDGNRISTTRGDCVEVVYGNYKLVVLGRITSDYDPTGNGGLGSSNTASTNTTLNHTSFEASGGHICEQTSTDGKVVSCTWKSDVLGGSWETVEQTDVGDKKTVYTGYYEREQYGESISVDIGNGASTISIDNGNNSAAGHANEKPDIETKIYARSVRGGEHTYDKRVEYNLSGAYKRKVDVHDKYTHAEAFQGHNHGVFTLGFREELMAKTIKKNINVTDWRFFIEIGAIGAEIVTVPYHETLNCGSDFRLWAVGATLDVIAGASASVRCGMDTYYPTGVAIDFNTGPQIELRSTADIVLGTSKVSGWLYRNLFSPIGKGVMKLVGSEVAASDDVA